MIALAFDNDAQQADFLRPAGKNILNDDEHALATAVFISLFTDRRAEPEDIVAGDDARGWWADVFSTNQGDLLGSRLWLLRRDGRNAQQRAVIYAKEALAWLLDDGVASAVTATATPLGPGALLLSMAIDRPGLLSRFEGAWKVLHAI